MAITLKIIFYLCCTWLVIMIFSTILLTIVIGIEYGKAWIDNYFENWYTYFAFAFVGIRLAGSLIIENRKRA